ncbi:MAG: PQQ-dependent sugar dehydrogenase [Novosphingobium sp.]|jgi:glucose/arabinose dehydrogenase|nr:PQQ-dependent sugar dehydrogenase [Novosphingobium sp.]
MNPRLRKALIVLCLIVLALVLFGAWVLRGNPSERSTDQTSGTQPLLVEPESETFPSVGLARPIGWRAGEAPVPAAGLAVGRFAEGLDHPRTMLTLPNGDVLVAETNRPADGAGGGITGFFMRRFMAGAGAGGPSPDRIVLLRDADGDGRAEQRFAFRQRDLASPSGMAWGNGKLYVANHNAVLAFAFTPGATELTGTPQKLMDLPPGGNHWMRNLLLSPDGGKLYVAVGSSSNIGENGMERETGRAAIWELDLASGKARPFAAGMRNPNGMGWNPSTSELWAVVQERDMLGPDLVPDYLTNVPVGVQYGWPWVYWRDVIDWRVKAPMPDYLIEYTRKPEYAMGAHSAVLGLLFADGGHIMGERFANGAFIARHGSWNRKPPAGYDVVFVRFDDHGNPRGLPLPVLTGFLTGRGKETRGRPVWLAWDKPGALLVSDDTGGVVWRVSAPGARPSAAPRPVVTEHMPPRRSLDGDPAARVEATLGEERHEMQQR